MYSLLQVAQEVDSFYNKSERMSEKKTLTAGEFIEVGDVYRCESVFGLRSFTITRVTKTQAVYACNDVCLNCKIRRIIGYNGRVVEIPEDHYSQIKRCILRGRPQKRRE